MQLGMLLLAVVSSALAVHAGDCSNQHPDLKRAVDEFCNKKDAHGHYTNDLVIPSSYAAAGHRVGRTFVSINGDCNPGQWVPADVCVKQFHDMCDLPGQVSGRNAYHGWSGGKSGQGQCQRWFFSNTN